MESLQVNECLENLVQSLKGAPVMVTGASGRIGHRLISTLVAGKVPVSAMSRGNSVGFPEGVQHCRADLLQPDSLPACLKNIACIFHLASYAPKPGELKPEENILHHDVTVEGTCNLLRAAEISGVPSLVFASSTRVIDGSKSLYAKAKREAEKQVLAASARLNTTVLRLSPVYGFANAGSVAQMLVAIDNRRFPPIPDCGDRHSMVHVDDVVQALLLSISPKKSAGKIYTVTDMQQYSSRQIYELICGALGKKPSPHAIPKWLLGLVAQGGSLLEFLMHRRMPLNNDRLNALCHSAVFDGQALSDELGYIPAYTLESALPEIVAQYTKAMA
jgi:nucleoside-diphosphate-sugar epimerase